jgi:hypothetical protein
MAFRSLEVGMLSSEVLLLLLQMPGKFFKIKFFFSLPGEVFLIKKKKKKFL